MIATAIEKKDLISTRLSSYPWSFGRAVLTGKKSEQIERGAGRRQKAASVERSAGRLVQVRGRVGFRDEDGSACFSEAAWRLPPL